MADVVVSGLRLHVQRLGAPSARPPVVFLHGLVMDNLSSWFFTAATAAAKTGEVVLYDLRGHGLSERPRQGYGLAAHVADLAGLLDAIGVDRPVTLVGNSFGGLLAVAFARAYPARTASLVLVDGHLGDEGFGAQMAETLRLTGEARDQRIAASFASWLGRHSERKRTRLAENARDLVEGTTLVDDMQATPPLTRDDLAAIRAPVLALYGERSDLRARGEVLLAGLPNVTVEIVPGCTHSIIWEATETVKARILQAVDGGGAGG